MAGRIPQNFIDDLLTRVDIVDVIDGYVPLRKAGRNYLARCPFHEEKTPSFTVSQEKQFYHCFGCGANGTAIGFLMEYARMDFVEAVEDLASRAGVVVPRENGGPYPRQENSTELYELMEMAIRFYSKQLREHPEAARAVEYLKARGLSGQTAADFELGFAPSGWDNLISNMGKSDAALQRLLRIGLVINKEGGGYYDRFRERIIFPIRDQRGRAIGLGGRVFGDGTPKYLNSPETPIFHKGRELYGLYQARRKQKDLATLLVVEGYMDVLALAQYGIHNAVATLGTAVTPDHLERLFKVCPQLVFCFDGDMAGQNAAWRALEIALPLIRDGRRVYFMFMPEGEDPDTYVRRHGAEKFTDTANHVSLSDYLLNTLRQGIDVNTREGRALLAEKSFPLLGKLPAGALQELLIKDLSVLCQLPPDSIKELLRGKSASSGHKNVLRNTTRSAVKHGHISLVSKAISMLLQHPAFGRDQALSGRLSGINDQGVDFLRELLQYISVHPETTCAGILEHWRDTKYELRLKELAVVENPLTEVAAEESALKNEFMDYISKIVENACKRQREIQSQNISSLDEFRRLYGDGNNTQKKEQT
ncbi:MAG: DNA primase [Gammaproteobacteria bacterium]